MYAMRIFDGSKLANICEHFRGSHTCFASIPSQYKYLSIHTKEGESSYHNGTERNEFVFYSINLVNKLKPDERMSRNRIETKPKKSEPLPGKKMAEIRFWFERNFRAYKSCITKEIL